MKLLANLASFVVMTLVIFVGVNCILLGPGISTGPNLVLRCGLTGWLRLHHQERAWSIESVDRSALFIEICLTILTTLAFAKFFKGLRRFRRLTRALQRSDS